MYISSKNPTETVGNVTDLSGQQGKSQKNIRLIPSSSEDLTLASTTSETNGRNTTILNVTVKRNLRQTNQNARAR